MVNTVTNTLRGIKMKKFTTPYNLDSEIQSHFNIKAQVKYATKIAKSMDEIIEPIGDIGIDNLKSAMIRKIHNIQVHQIGTGFDWNRSMIKADKFGTLTFYDSLEHLLNPLLFLDGVYKIIKPGGLLYICLPQRPSWLWTEHHFHEIEDSRCKYLFKESGFKVEYQTKISFWRLKFGVRPLIRYFYDKTTLYKLRKDK